MSWDGGVGGGADGLGAVGGARAEGGDAGWWGVAARSARGLTGAESTELTVRQMRDSARLIAGSQASQLRLVAELDTLATAEAVLTLAWLPRVPGAPHDDEVIDSAVTAEVQAALGIGAGPAVRMVHLARRLTRVLPVVLDGLSAGRLDLARATVLAVETEVLPDGLARAVADRLLGVAGAAPWEGLSPRAWKGRVERAVIRADGGAARRRREQAFADRAVRSVGIGAGMAELVVTADAAAIALAEAVLTDLANQRPRWDASGAYLPIQARRVDAFVELFDRVNDGTGLPGVSVRRERHLGLVLHADTFFADSPAADDPGEVRGLGGHHPIDPVTAREQAHALLHPAPDPGFAAGAGSRRPAPVTVFLVDPTGGLQRLVQLGAPPPGGWTRALLTAAVTTRLGEPPPALGTESYAPTVAIAEQVRARNPRCTGYDCPRPADRCDLDHDTPWPRGPTQVANLAPRCRRHHNHKTRRLVHTTLHPDGSVDTQTLTGINLTTRPEPLPGHAPGESHAPGR